MNSSRQRLTTVLARGGVPTLACLCCSFCTAEPDVVFWTLEAEGGTTKDGGGVTGIDSAAAETTVDSATNENDAGSWRYRDAGTAQESLWCVDGGLADLTECNLPLYVFPDSGSFDPTQSADAGLVGEFQLVPGPDQCGDKANAGYVDDSGWPRRIIACPRACDNIKVWLSSFLRTFLGC